MVIGEALVPVVEHPFGNEICGRMYFYYSVHTGVVQFSTAWNFALVQT